MCVREKKKERDGPCVCARVRADVCVSMYVSSRFFERLDPNNLYKGSSQA